MNPRAALRAFVNQSGVHVKDIAAAMGFSRAHLYLLMDPASRHFPSRKRALVIENFTGIPADDWRVLSDASIEAA